MFRNNDVSDGGRPVLIEPPDYGTTPIVSLDECKTKLGISSSSQDALLAFALDVATATLDPASDGFLGRSLGATTWELQLQSFNDRRPKVRPFYDPLSIPLLYPPLLKIVSVKYLDVNGVDTAMIQDTDFRVFGTGERIQAIAPLLGKSWPVARVDHGSVRIRYMAGYDGEANKLPPQISAAICLGVRALLPVLQRDQMLFEDRVEGVGSKRYQNNPEFTKVVQNTIADLLRNLKID
jgi:hypothetical protein